MPGLLDRVADALASDRAKETEVLIRTAPSHGETRFHQNFNLNELLIEYHCLRRILTEEISDELGRDLTTTENVTLDLGVDTALRRGVKSSSSALIPSFARTPATYIAATCSFPGGFVVLILMRSVSQPCASLAIAEVLPIGDGLPGIPGPPAGETCAAIGKLATIANAAVPAMLWTIRFQFTNPSSS